MPTAAVTLDTLADRFPGSFANHIDYNHGPRGAIGRYMLAAEARLDDIGVTLKRVDPMEMVRLNRAVQSSWWRQVAVLDAEDNPPRGDELMCWIGYDRSGKPVTANSMRLMDLGGATLKEEMESLRLFYGRLAEEKRKTVTFEINSPYASRPQHEMVYTGGFWVDPSMRGSGISMIVPKISYYAAIAIWGAPVSLSIVRDVMMRPDIAETYNFEGAEPRFEYRINGQVQWEGMLVWLSRPYLEARLETEIARLAPPPSADDGRGEEALSPANTGRKQQA